MFIFIFCDNSTIVTSISVLKAKRYHPSCKRLYWEEMTKSFKTGYLQGLSLFVYKQLKLIFLSHITADVSLMRPDVFGSHWSDQLLIDSDRKLLDIVALPQCMSIN